MQQHSVWYFGRVFLLVLALAFGPFADRDLHDGFPLTNPPTLLFVLAVVGFCVLGIGLLRLMFLANSRFETSWQKPSWEEPLFTFSTPLANFEIVGYCLVAEAFGSGVYAAIRSFDYVWVLFATIGLGVLLGVQIAAERRSVDDEDAAGDT